jgi:RNA polymerase-binding transcription factor DksA
MPAMEHSPSSAGPPPPEWRAVAEARLREQRAELRRRVARLTEDMAGLVEASQGSNADDEHDPEGQTIAYERSQLSAVTGQAHEHLAELDAALERVRAGTYGVCEVCGLPIDPARLEARPTARTCVQHVPDRNRRS